MSKIYLKIAFLILIVAVTSCETFVSTKTLDREIFTFKHAGENISLPVELQEIRTSRRKGPLLIGNREVSYAYAMVLLSDDGQEMFHYPCEEKSSIDEFIGKLKIKRSKDRKHFAIGAEGQTAAIFHLFNKKRFLGYAPLINTDETAISFKDLDVNSLEEPRALLLDHISGDKVIKSLDENPLTDMLCSISPQDELNQEAIYMLTDNRVAGLSRDNETRLINHCKKSENWRKRALFMLRENKQNLEDQSFINKLFALGGKEAVEKEDWNALKEFAKEGDISYFSMRMEMTNPPLSSSVQKEFKIKLASVVYNVCTLSDNQRKDILSMIRLLEKLGERHVFEQFVEKYDHSKCKSATIHEVNNALMFISDIKSSETRLWVDFMVRNFETVRRNDRSWVYDRIKEELTCSEKRGLLLKYKRDIDVYNDMEVPECN